MNNRDSIIQLPPPKREPQVLQEAIDHLHFCFNLRSDVFLPFLFCRLITGFFAFVLLSLLLFFLFVNIIERDFFPCSQRYFKPA